MIIELNLTQQKHLNLLQMKTQCNHSTEGEEMLKKMMWLASSTTQTLWLNSLLKGIQNLMSFPSLAWVAQERPPWPKKSTSHMKNHFNCRAWFPGYQECKSKELLLDIFSCIMMPKSDEKHKMYMEEQKIKFTEHLKGKR